MKRYFSIILWLLLSISAFSFDTPIPQYKGNIIGNVKKIKQAVKTQREASILQDYKTTNIVFFDTSGNITLHIYISPEGDTTSSCTFYYNENGNLIKRIQQNSPYDYFKTIINYNDKNMIVEQHTNHNETKNVKTIKYYYNNSGDIFEIREFHSDNTIEKIHYYFNYDENEFIDWYSTEYLENYILKEESIYNSENNFEVQTPLTKDIKVFVKYLYFLNQNDNIVKKIYISFDDVRNVSSYYYNNSNKKSKVVETDSEGKFISSHKYFYDKNGLLKKRVRIFVRGKSKIKWLINYKYDEIGNWIEQESNRPDYIEIITREIEYY